jgi:DNA-binding XRE family transcriptional regulator
MEDKKTMITTVNFHSTVKNFRKQHQLSQEQFAKRIHVTQETISNWERGKRKPTLNAILQLCQSFNISVEDLLNVELF